MTLIYNGFHGYTHISFRPLGIERRTTVDCDPVFDPPTYSVAIVSARTAKRLNRLVCGQGSCKCGEHVCEMHGPSGETLDYCAVPLPKAGEIRGNYPTQ